jgi:uncharacterized protein YjbJ (UPF0337 family)
MDENRIAGTAKNIGGKVEEGFGRVTGDSKSQVEGIASQAAGAAQDLYGQARDSAATGFSRVSGKVAPARHRDSAVYNRAGCSGHRLASRQNAPPALSSLRPRLYAACGQERLTSAVDPF